MSSKFTIDFLDSTAPQDSELVSIPFNKPPPPLTKVYFLTLVDNSRLLHASSSNVFRDKLNRFLIYYKRKLELKKVIFEVQPKSKKLHCHLLVVVSDEKDKYSISRGYKQKLTGFDNFSINFQKVQDENHYKRCLDYERDKGALDLNQYDEMLYLLHSSIPYPHNKIPNLEEPHMF